MKYHEQIFGIRLIKQTRPFLLIFHKIYILSFCSNSYNYSSGVKQYKRTIYLFFSIIIIYYFQVLKTI